MTPLPQTLLSLDEFRSALGLMPWWFFGLSDTDALRPSAQCPQVTKLYAWQNDGIAGRYELLEAIQSAEAKLFRWLGYRIAPQYVEATVPWPKLGDMRQSRLAPVDAIGRWLNVDLPEGMVQEIGIEARTLISSAAAVALSDKDGDGINEQFTIGPLATTVTDSAEIACYFVSTDRPDGDPISECYRVRPLQVTISGGFVTIRGPAWLLARPVREQSPVSRDTLSDPSAPGVLATNLDVYRRYTDTNGTTTATSQSVLTWETRPCHGSWCCCAGCSGSASDPAAISEAVGRAGIRNARLGLVAPATAVYDQVSGTWATSCCEWCDEPDRVTIRYLAGYPLDDGQRIASELRTVVARLAAAEMGRPICACDEANRELYRWQFDLAQSSTTEAHNLSPDALDCPFGTRRGQIEAWRWALRMQQTRGLLAG